jgi:hypothetical protein
LRSGFVFVWFRRQHLEGKHGAPPALLNGHSLLI